MPGKRIRRMLDSNSAHLIGCPQPSDPNNTKSQTPRRKEVIYSSKPGISQLGASKSAKILGAPTPLGLILRCAPRRRPPIESSLASHAAISFRKWRASGRFLFEIDDAVRIPVTNLRVIVTVHPRSPWTSGQGPGCGRPAPKRAQSFSRSILILCSSSTGRASRVSVFRPFRYNSST